MAQVRAVLDRQRAGMSLAAAVRAVQSAVVPVPSIFAAVAAASGRLAARRSRRAMLAISRAIEDACAASGEASTIVGSFQREAVFRACEPRWTELARGARACVVLADFAQAGTHDGIIEVPIGVTSPLRREWSVAVAGPGVQACVAGWEWLGQGTGWFEAIWSVEPHVVAAAVGRGLELAREHLPGVAPAEPLPPPDGDPLQRAIDLFDRVVTRLDRA